MGVGEGGFSNGGTGRERGKGGGKGVRAEGEGKRGAEGAREALALPALGGSRGTDAAVPGRATSLCRGRWRGAGEGRRARRGCGEGGDYSTGRRIGCIQSQSGCKLGPGLVAWGARGSAAGGWGRIESGVGGGNLERGHLLQLSPRQLGAFAQTTPPPLPGNFFL